MAVHVLICKDEDEMEKGRKRSSAFPTVRETAEEDWSPADARIWGKVSDSHVSGSQALRHG